jgi:hypothetical protein
LPELHIVITIETQHSYYNLLMQMIYGMMMNVYVLVRYNMSPKGIGEGGSSDEEFTAYLLGVFGSQ